MIYIMIRREYKYPHIINKKNLNNLKRHLIQIYTAISFYYYVIPMYTVHKYLNNTRYLLRIQNYLIDCSVYIIQIIKK